MIRFFWINLVSVMIHLKYLYYNISSLELSCLPHHLCWISLWSTETPVSAILIMFFISFQSCPTPFFHTLQLLDIPNSFSQPYWWIRSALQSPPKSSSTSTDSSPLHLSRSIYRLYMFIKSSLKSSLTLLSPILQQFFTSLILRTENSIIYIKSIFRISAI